MAAIVQAYYQAYRGLPRAVWLLALLLLVNRCGTMVLPFLTIYLSKVKGYDASQAVQLLSVYGAGGIVGAYLGGWLTQRLGAMRVVVASLLLSAPGYLGIPYCHTLPALVAVLFYLAVAAEMVRPAIATATSENSPPEALARSFALNRLALNLGMSIGPAIGGALAALGYWRLLFSINGAFALATAGAAAALFDLRSAPAAAQDPPGARQPGSPWDDHGFLAYLALQTLGGLVFFQIMSTLPVYLSEQYRLREDQIGLLFVLNTVLIVLFEMVLIDRLRRFHSLHLVAVGLSLICLGFGGAVFGQGFAFAAFLVLVWTAGEMLFAPAGITYVARRAAGRKRGAYMGLNSVSLSVAGVGAPLIGGLLYRVDPQLPWWCCLAMAVLLPCGFWALAQRDAPKFVPDDAAA